MKKMAAILRIVPVLSPRPQTLLVMEMSALSNLYPAVVLTCWRHNSSNVTHNSTAFLIFHVLPISFTISPQQINISRLSPGTLAIAETAETAETAQGFGHAVLPNSLEEGSDRRDRSRTHFITVYSRKRNFYSSMHYGQCSKPRTKSSIIYFCSTQGTFSFETPVIFVPQQGLKLNGL